MSHLTSERDFGNETFQESARALTSKPAQRAFINTVLLISGTAILYCLAAIASALFFQSFVPDQFVTTPLHLQYGLGSNPYGVAALSASLLKSHQVYDISVTLSMPRSSPNVERGNFMVSLYLLDLKNSEALAVGASRLANGQPDFEHHRVLFNSRRPVLVPYVDPVVSMASRILFLFYHMLFPHSQTCMMIIPLAERITFSQESLIPTSAYVEVEAGQAIQIYDAAMTMTAQLSGLRWLMFHYRLSTYFVFTSLFWVCELLFMSVAWAVLSSIIGYPIAGKVDQKSQVKRRRYAVNDEREEIDKFDGRVDTWDYPQRFPTYGKQPPLKHEPEVKKEEERERPWTEIPIAGAEADDEDDESEDRWQRDSGLGTSYSEEGSGSILRRASHRMV